MKTQPGEYCEHNHRADEYGNCNCPECEVEFLNKILAEKDAQIKKMKPAWDFWQEHKRLAVCQADCIDEIYGKCEQYDTCKQYNRVGYPEIKPTQPEENHITETQRQAEKGVKYFSGLCKHGIPIGQSCEECKKVFDFKFWNKFPTGKKNIQSTWDACRDAYKKRFKPTPTKEN